MRNIFLFCLSRRFEYDRDGVDDRLSCHFQAPKTFRASLRLASARSFCGRIAMSTIVAAEAEAKSNASNGAAVDWDREFESDGETIDQLFGGAIGTTYK